jgi:predicted metal-dependent hydrolase
MQQFDEGRQLFEEGVRLYNEGEFFEAHEMWESLWAEDVSEAREFYQGLIQAAAAFFKLESGVPVGTVKLLTKCLPLLRMYPDTFLGFRVREFREALAACLREAERVVEEQAAEFDARLIPKLIREQ